MTTLLALLAATLCITAEAILVQPNNYMLDDSSMVNQEADGGSLAPFYNDQGSEQAADKDIISIIGDRLARLRYARMLENPDGVDSSNAGHFSQEMAELIQREQQEAAASHNNGKPLNHNQQEQSLSASVADMLLNVAQAAAQASAGSSDDIMSGESGAQHTGIHHNNHGQDQVPVASRGHIMELDTSAGGSTSSMPSKADLKTSSQWFNPKETIPVLKISSMGE